MIILVYIMGIITGFTLLAAVYLFLDIQKDKNEFKQWIKNMRDTYL